MNFKEAVEHITDGEKHFKERALPWIERFIAAAPTNDKEFLADWFSKKGSLDKMVADLYRGFFAQWKREDKSRKASAAGKKGAKTKRKADRKTDKRSVGKKKKLVRFVEREQGPEIARMLVRNEIEQGVDYHQT